MARFLSRDLVARLLLELAVVFVGVYAAFALQQWEAEREQERRREQVEQALAREIQSILVNASRVARAMPHSMAARDSARRAGAMPDLTPMLEPIGFQTHVWESTLQSGASDLFDVPTFYALSEFYNTLNAGFAQLGQLRQLSETILLPNLGAPMSEFYETDPVRLKPKYRWYDDGLERLGGIAVCVTVLGDSVLTRLGERPDTTTLDPTGCD